MSALDECRYQVFVSSTFKDLESERQKVPPLINSFPSDSHAPLTLITGWTALLKAP